MYCMYVHVHTVCTIVYACAYVQVYMYVYIYMCVCTGGSNYTYGTVLSKVHTHALYDVRISEHFLCASLQTHWHELMSH